MECDNYICLCPLYFFNDREVFCLACTKLGNTAICPGDCRDCV
jgi:hypothetical protein